MQGYGEGFARVYNRKWNDFSRWIAPLAEQLFTAHDPAGGMPRTLLDVCCGTGRLAAHFLERGWRVRGVDLSPHMLAWAAENNRQAVSEGRASFAEADAASFTVPEPVSFATCLFDAMNHLPSLEAMASCIRRAHESLLPGGLFLFDVNTRASLLRWNQVSVQEDDEIFILNRGVFEPSMDRAYANITGFIREPDGRYARFSEVAYNTVVSIEGLRAAVAAAGFTGCHCADGASLDAPATDPESLRRAFFVCRKGAS
jgi:SAM-dependent methyltransferase